MEKRAEYKAQICIHMEGEEINIGIKNVERAIRSLKNNRICGLEGIYVELLKVEPKNYGY